MLKGVQIFQFSTGPEGLGSFWPNGYICITPETSFFHVAVADIKITDNGSEIPKVSPGFFRRTDIRFADDLHQGHAGSIEIDHAQGTIRVMGQFAGVFFHVYPCNADPFFSAVFFYIHKSVASNGQLIL